MIRALSKNNVLAIALTCLAVVMPSHLTANQLKADERKLVAIIDDQESAALEQLETIVNINSGTMNFEGVKKVGEFFANEYRELGFKVVWIDGEGFNRAGHLLATYGADETNTKGSEGLKLLLIGHLDTVFAKDSLLQQYQPIGNGRIMGPGITDMKGGDIVMLYAIKALAKTGLLAGINIKVILTGDEEKRGRPLDIATKALIDAGKWADVAIGFEDGDGDPTTAVTARRGSTGWSLDVVGKANHSSQIFRQGYGYGAIFETARILNAFREQLETMENLTFNPGLLLGGSEAELDNAQARGKAFGKNNVIAKTTKTTGDIRALTPAQLDQAKQKMHEIVKHNLAETSATLVFNAGYPPMAASVGNSQLLAIYNKVSVELGLGKVKAVDPRKAGAADISFVAEHVDMAIDGLGLMGSGGHTIDETADIETLSQQTKRAALLLYRLGQ